MMGDDLRPRGLRLTIDHDLQQTAAEALGDQIGCRGGDGSGDRSDSGDGVEPDVRSQQPVGHGSGPGREPNSTRTRPSHC